MSDDIDDLEGPEPTDEELAVLAAFLDDPALWSEPSADVEDRLLTALAADPGDDAGPSDDTGPSDAGPGDEGPGDEVVPLDDIRRRTRGRVLLTFAAGLALVAAGAVAVLRARSGPDDVAETDEVTLAGGSFAPAASATAEIDERSNGVHIVLRVENLDPAPPGTFYAAWVVREDPPTRVGIGSFHMRGSADGNIVLWAGVSTDDYPIVSVTLQSEDDPDGAGEPVLRGRRQP